MPSFIEVSGVRNSWDMVEKNSDFIFSTRFSLSHITLNALVSSAISGGEPILRSPLKMPLETSFVFSIKIMSGFLMLRVVKNKVQMTRIMAITNIKIVNLRDDL